MSNVEPIVETQRSPTQFRYSLRTLLLSVGILSLGMGYWWQRSFEIEVLIAAKASSPPPAHLDSSTELFPDGRKVEEKQNP